MVFHGRHMVIDPGYERLFKAQEIATPEDVASRWTPGVAPPGMRSKVAELRLPHGNSHAHLFVKTYHYTGLWWMRTWGIPARVFREYENLVGLGRLGFKVPRPVAWGVTRTFGFLNDSFLVTEAVEKGIDLRDLTVHPERCPFPFPDRRQRHDLITTLARNLRRCHDAGWFIHTAFFKNLLLTKESGGYQLWMIDVPFAHIWRNRVMPDRARVRDFATLAKGAMKLLTRTERMRFCKAYGNPDRAFLRRVDAYRLRYYPH